MNKFISCDWGTTSLRLRLIENETQNIVAEIISQQGIAATYARWKKSSSDRLLFYESELSSGIQELSSQYGYPLSEIPVIVSGMASSAIGMMELAYKMLPFKTDGNDLLVHIAEPSGRFRHRLIIVSGVKSANDVMRGEETIFAGCDINNDGEQLYILPGTHSKHIITGNGVIKDFKTYMTGELFGLLSTKSILSNSVEKENTPTEIANAWFDKGVKEAAADNLLNSIFHVRTNLLFKKLQPKENYYYLSGLLIGTELKDLVHNNYTSVTLVSDEKFLPLYSQALHILEVTKDIQYISADKALVKGQSHIYKIYQ